QGGLAGARGPGCGPQGERLSDLMRMRESITLAVDALRANKLRAILTSIGVIIGSASIVLVVTVALTSRKYVISQIEAVGSNLVWAELVKTPDKAQPLDYELTLNDMADVKTTVPGVAEVAGISAIPMAVVVHANSQQSLPDYQGTCRTYFRL